jgi:hypothetical protein
MCNHDSNEKIRYGLQGKILELSSCIYAERSKLIICLYWIMRNKDESYTTRILHMRITKIRSLSQFLGCIIETLALCWNLLTNHWSYCIVGIYFTLAVIFAPSRKILDE